MRWFLSSHSHHVAPFQQFDNLFLQLPSFIHQLIHVLCREGPRRIVIGFLPVLHKSSDSYVSRKAKATQDLLVNSIFSSSLVPLPTIMRPLLSLNTPSLTSTVLARFAVVSGRRNIDHSQIGPAIPRLSHIPSQLAPACVHRIQV